MANRQLRVQKGRTNSVPVSLGFDVSADTITSEIREDKDHESELLATWVVTKPNGGADGELLLTLDDAITGAIVKSKGYMDLKRVTGSEPVPVFDEPLEVIFEDFITV